MVIFEYGEYAGQRSNPLFIQIKVKSEVTPNTMHNNIMHKETNTPNIPYRQVNLIM